MQDSTTPKRHDLVESVHRFNTIGQVVPPDGTFNADRVGFYTGMQCEELAEKLNAIAYGTLTVDQQSHMRAFANMLDSLGKEFKRGLHRGSILRSDREAVMDGDIDVLVVTLGSLAYQSGTYTAAIDAVLDANAAKMPGGVAKHDENGKIVKPAGWKAPDLAPFIVHPVS